MNIIQVDKSMPTLFQTHGETIDILLERDRGT